MPAAFFLVFPALWLAWLLYWGVAALGAKRTERRESAGSRLLHALPLMLAAYLIWADRVPGRWLNERLLAWRPWQFWIGALLTALGLGFAVWARVQLGRNWSATVTIKQDHELVTSGPYAIVRHPIYTGLLVAFAGSALARGEWRSAAAIVIAWAAIWRKLKLEERWMVERFGERYRAYRERLPALVPFAKGWADRC